MKRSDAVEEVIADACEMVLKDSKAVEKLAKENKSLAQTIADWLHGFYEDIKAAFEGVESRSKEAKAMTDYMDELVKLWDDALIEASKGESKQSGKVKRSDRGTSKMYRFEEQLNNWANMKPNDTFLVGATPKVWRDVGLANLPVSINQQHIDYAVNGTKDADHHLGLDMVKQLPQAIKKPIAIIRSDTRGRDSVVVILKLEHTLPDGTKKQVIAPVNVNVVGTQNNISFDANTISSYFGKGNILEKLRNAINDENNGKTSVYWINKKEAYNVMSAAGLKLPSHTLHSGFIHSISESGSPVNQKITDITDSRQFKSWFGKSKIVDDNGRPMVVYHGSTDKEIRTFRTNNVMGTGGLYLTSDKAVADVFAGKNGKVYPAYARVENPLIIDADYVMYDSIPADKVPNGLRKKFPSWDSFDTNAIVMWARENGRYDGVWIKNVREAGMYSYADDIVVFDPNQIKSVYNVGTFGKNDNIYYSRRDSSEGLTKEEARAQAQAYTRLKAENAALQRRLEYWQEQTKRTKQRTINRGDVDRYARQLIKMHGSTVDEAWLKQKLREMGDYLVQTEEPDYSCKQKIISLAINRLYW